MSCTHCELVAQCKVQGLRQAFRGVSKVQLRSSVLILKDNKEENKSK
jgi:hypothetical protein